MDGKSYRQYCGLAAALDRVGERWTLLIVRELLLGPRRYSELKGALPGIATNLLAARLRQLEDDGIARRMADGHGKVVYDLTERGRGLEDAIHALVRWGGSWMGEREPDALFRPQWLAIALRALIAPDRARALEPTVELRVEGETLHLRNARDGIEAVVGPAPAPDVVLSASPRIVLGLAGGAIGLRDAVGRGLAVVAGSREAVRQLERLFGGPSGIR